MKNKKIYFIGIKGVGMTMLAQFLKQRGNVISGSDIKDTFLTDAVLSNEKIRVFTPPKEKNLYPLPDIIVHSSAFTPQNNPEMAHILSKPEVFKNIPLISYAACLGQIFNDYYGIAVCGSHGKTTTSAWLGYVLKKAGKEPNVLVGSSVSQFKGSALVGRSRYFVAEVDEYQNKLKYFNPKMALINNIEFDHPDFFPDEKSYIKVFSDFIKKIPPQGFLIANNSDKNLRKIVSRCQGKVISYDVETAKDKADYVAYELEMKGGRQFFKLADQGVFSIRLLGRHNVYNALAVIASARALKVSWQDIKKHLAGFKGTARRTQVIGHYNKALIIDDYAHHPSEIKSTLAGLRARFKNKRIITVFHPHTYTRTRALFSDFISSFSDTDELIVLDIYGSAREKQGGVSSRQLVEEIKVYNKNKLKQQIVKHIPKMKAAASYLKPRLQEHDILVLMGAGDVFRLAGIILGKEK